MTRHLHAFTHRGVFEVVFLAQIRGDGCLQDPEQQFSDSISCSSPVPSECY